MAVTASVQHVRRGYLKPSKLELQTTIQQIDAPAAC